MSPDATAEAPLPLYHAGPFRVDLCDVAATSQRVRVGVVATPSRDDVERLATILLAWFRDATVPVVLHVEHISAPGEVAPPDMPSILLIVSTLMEHREVIQSRLLGTCVQATHLDDGARVARDLFLSLYQPERPLSVVDAAEEAERFCAKCARRAAREAAA